MVGNIISNIGHILNDVISKLAKDNEKAKSNDYASYFYGCALLDGCMWGDVSP